MTIHECLKCGYAIAKDDNKSEQLKGLCPECYAKDPRLVEKIPFRLPQRKDGNDWRRY